MKAVPFNRGGLDYGCERTRANRREALFGGEVNREG
jgi:hypothetical protein